LRVLISAWATSQQGLLLNLPSLQCR